MRCLIADILYSCASDEVVKLVNEDIDRNLKWEKRFKDIKNYKKKLNFLLKTTESFRNIFYMRMRKYKLLVHLSMIMLPSVKTIEISENIGGGVMISHNNSIVYCTAGKNLRVGPGVVVGRNAGKLPKIGNNVYIAANATVIGDVTIGDNVIIGAGSVVTKSLPGNGVYVGNPVRFIKNIDDDKRLLNEIM